MSTWAIGDVQGCFSTLQSLLERIAFDSAADRLWLVGDLVNRGPRSLEVLRWARDLGDRVITVLGNHDLHLLARHAGCRRPGRRDTLEAVLEAPDLPELIDWLRGRPLLHREGERTLVHAGLLPAWTSDQAQELAAEAEGQLRGDDWEAFLKGLYAKGPRTPLQEAVDVLTSIRACSRDGRPDYSWKGPMAGMPDHLFAWFALPRRGTGAVVFGHWAALGFHTQPGVLALDSGCVWGHCLTAWCLEDDRVVQQPMVDD